MSADDAEFPEPVDESIKEADEPSRRMPGDDSEEPAAFPSPRESKRPPPMPAFVQGVDDEDRMDPPATFVPNSEKIRQMVEDKASPVRAGADYPIERNFPKWRSATDLKREASKPINWQVSNLWTERAKILLAAEQKSGKTWIVCHAGICVAAGRPLFGHDRFRILKGGPVGIVAGEDDPGEIGRRMDRMCRAMGLLMSDLPIHFLEGHGMRLNRQRDQEMMKSAVRSLGLKLIIYDPLARLMDGDENSKEVVSALLNPASQLALDEDVSVMVVHHLGKQNNENPRTSIARVRGSSDITSWFSCGLFLSGQMRGGKLDVEVVQRTSGNVPNEFPVHVREDQDTSVYGLGTMRLEADLSAHEQDQHGRNQALIEEAAREILLLVRGKAAHGVTLSEIQVHLGYGRALTNAAVKKLVREEGAIGFEDADDIPEKKVLMPRMQRRPVAERPAPDPKKERDDDDDDFDPPDGQGELPIN
ncbi:MAG: AAA family ATPase [bacterium]